MYFYNALFSRIREGQIDRLLNIIGVDLKHNIYKHFLEDRIIWRHERVAEYTNYVPLKCYVGTEAATFRKIILPFKSNRLP